MEEFYENTQTETINGFEIPDCVIHSLAECLYSLMKEEYTANENNYIQEINEYKQKEEEFNQAKDKYNEIVNGLQEKMNNLSLYFSLNFLAISLILFFSTFFTLISSIF